MNFFLVPFLNSQCAFEQGLLQFSWKKLGYRPTNPISRGAGTFSEMQVKLKSVTCLSIHYVHYVSSHVCDPGVM